MTGNKKTATLFTKVAVFSFLSSFIDYPFNAAAPPTISESSFVMAS